MELRRKKNVAGNNQVILKKKSNFFVVWTNSVDDGSGNWFCDKINVEFYFRRSACDTDKEMFKNTLETTSNVIEFDIA